MLNGTAYRLMFRNLANQGQSQFVQQGTYDFFFGTVAPYRKGSVNIKGLDAVNLGEKREFHRAYMDNSYALTVPFNKKTGSHSQALSEVGLNSVNFGLVNF